MKRDVNKTTGQRVKRLREERKLTQTQLAAAIAVPCSSLSRMEAGKLRWTLEAVYDAAAALDVQVGALLGLDTVGRTPREGGDERLSA